MEPEDWEEFKEGLKPLWTLILSAVIVTLTVKATLWLLDMVVSQIPKV